jgi:hypothetical protein
MKTALKTLIPELLFSWAARLSPGHLTLMLVMGATALSQTAAQQTAQNRPTNFDIRISKDAASEAYIQRFGKQPGAQAALLAGTRAAGIAQLRGNFTVDMIDNPELGTPEVVTARPGARFLSGPTANRPAAMRAFLATYADAYGISPDEARNLTVVSDFVNPAGNMAWVEFEQRINSLPVFRGLIRGGFTARGELAGMTGPLASGLDAKLLPTAPVLSATQAISRAVGDVGWPAQGALSEKGSNGGVITIARGSMADDAKAWLLYFPLGPGTARLAWATEIWGNPDAFLVLIDAEDGTVLFRKNLTEYQSQPATYSVYKDDSPAPLSPTTAIPGSAFQAPYISRTSVTLIGNEPPNTFNNLGWMTDGSNVTDGNNVQAGIDRDGMNGVDAPVTGSSRVFNFGYNPQTDGPLTTPYQNGEVTDTFYWTNTYHDQMYLLGFTEAAGNFQNDNFGRGGLGGDRISAEAQDSSGTNNANFSTPADGGRGRMQMFVFPGPTPDRSSGLDHEVLIHELTHGTSNRLHNNASGLTTVMARGMGEGWSDFYGRALLSTAAEDPNGIYASGGWVTHQLSAGYTDNYYYGIRRFPYAVMSNVGTNGKPHNPLTFADIDSAQMSATDGAFPRNPLFGGAAFEVHNVGEVWCMALLEVRARFISRLGYATGNQRILQFVTDGMKLDPANPTFLQGRDSILAAANAGGGTAADINDIWSGFAVRGMGFSAQVLNASTGTVVEAFDLPGISAGAGSGTSESISNGRLDPGESITASLCIANPTATISGTITGTLFATGGVTSPSAPQSYGAIAAGANMCRPFTFVVNTTCGATLTATLQANENGGSTRNLLYRFDVGSQFAFSTENFDGVVAPALPTSWATSTLSGNGNLWSTVASSSDSSPNRAATGDPASVSDNVLTSRTIAVPAGASKLTFRHLFNTESGYDGGVLEIAIGGGAFQDILAAGGSFATGGYTRVLASTANPIGGRQAWTGNSGAYVTTTVNMPPAAAGQNATLRWRLGSDSSVSATGWSVDTVVLTSSQCGPATTPLITGITPAQGAPGTTVSAVITGGDLFAAGSVVFNGSGTTATIGTGGTATSLPVTISIAANASLGLNTVTVTTPAGTSAPFSGFNVAPLPTITSVTPNSAAQGATLAATIAGTNLGGAFGIAFSGSGVTATIGTGGTSTALPVTISIATSAALGARTFTVTTPIGASSAFNGFTVLSPPTITGITPGSGPQGANVSATIAGNNLLGASAVTFSGTGVTATIGSGGTSTAVPVMIAIAATAQLSSPTITLTTPQGTSIPFSGFTVTPTPSITSFTPIGGSAGTVVAILGKNWSSATGVAFNGTPAASFTIVQNDAELITNPGFETSNLAGWTKADQGAGTFHSATGTSTPVSNYPTAGPRTGTRYAVSDMNSPSASALIQSFTVPSTASKVTLSFSMFVNDQDSGPIVNPAGLDYSAIPNQHARVDILTEAAAPFDTGNGVLRNFYLSVDPHTNPNPYRSYSFDITDLVGSGGTFQVRFAEVNNQFFLNMGVDDVSILSQSTTVLAVVPQGATTGPISLVTPGGVATSSTNFTMTGAGTSSTSLTSSDNPSVSGQAVTLTATVSGVSPAGTPTGSVVFKDGTTQIGTSVLNGAAQATLTTGTLSVGAHSITAQYVGDPAYQGSSASLTQTNNKATSVTTVTSSANPSGVSQSVTMTATVGVVAPGVGTPAGTATFFDSTTPIGTTVLNSSGQASLIFNGTGTNAAAYNSTLKAPGCSIPGSACDSGTLLAGRDNITNGHELNQPNTIHSACADATIGTYRTDESIERLRVTTLDGTTLAPGKVVRIDVDVWALYSGDRLDLYYTNDAANPIWIYITTLSPASSGPLTLSATYTLPAGGLQAIRAHYRDGNAGGGVSSCAQNSWDDHDDLIFAAGTLSPGSHSMSVQYSGSALYTESTSTPFVQVVGNAGPTISAITPNSGASGSIAAVISGTDLMGATAVTFSGSGVTATIASGGTASALPVTISIAPGPFPGLRTVTVTTPGGTSSPFTGFLIGNVPSITSITPNSGAPGSTVSAVLSGTNLTGPSAVTFSGSGVTATIGSGGSASALPVTISIAAGATLGMRTVAVTATGGTSSPFSGFLVGSTPGITSITPSTGSPGSVLDASIAGINLTGATAVTFSGSGVTATIGSGGTASTLPITVSIAAGAALGMRSVSVTATGGTSAPFTGFLIGSTPTITAISPKAAPPGSTTSALLVGTNLNGISAVTFSGAGVTATIGTNGTATSQPIAISIAAGAALGLRTVTVTTPGGTSSPFSGFTVGFPPAITAVSPNSGSPGTNIAATLFGTNLSGASAVTLSGSGVTATIGPGGTASTLPVTIAIAAGAAPGLRTITLNATTGVSSQFSGFAVGSAPAITSIGPNSGQPGSTVGAVIAGVNLGGASAVAFSGSGVTATIGSGGTSSTVPVTISIAAGAALGQRTVTLTATSGTSSPFSGFTVANATRYITSFTPASGASGTMVTLSGRNLGGTSGVSFNGTSASSFTLVPTTSQLITNAGFEIGDLDGWTRTNQGTGLFFNSPDPISPVSGFPTAGPHGGSVHAVSDMDSPGSATALIQPFTVSTAASRVTLSFSMFVNDQSSGPYINGQGLDYAAVPNQHARVDLLTSASMPFDTGAGVLRNFYLGVDPQPNPNPYRNYSFDITDLVSGGGTFQLRFAQVSNQSFLNMGVDDVGILSESTDVKAVVPANATSGKITITTPGGTAFSTTDFIVPGSPGPAITTLSPDSGAPGATLGATITGTNLSGATAVTFSGTGVTATIGTGGTATSTSLPMVISIAANAQVGLRTVTVTTPSGTSSPFSGFTISVGGTRRRGQVISVELLGEETPFKQDPPLLRGIGSARGGQEERRSGDRGGEVPKGPEAELNERQRPPGPDRRETRL